MIEGYVTEDIELDEGDEVSVLAQPDHLNVYIEDVSTVKLSSLHFLGRNLGNSVFRSTLNLRLCQLLLWTYIYRFGNLTVQNKD